MSDMRLAPAENGADASSARIRAGRLALGASLVIFALKLAAWWLTGSTAVLADAMESTINIVAAVMLVYTLSVASRPPDRDHPYGHGKAEFVSAAIEGGAIAFAAAVIVVEGVRELMAGPEVRDLDVGVVLLVVSTAANGLLGRYLVAVGERTNSPALEADGRHVLADVWTSVGVVGGLGVVALTGWTWADPLIAIAVGVHVASEGGELIREALGGLMDEADPDTIAEAAQALEEVRRDAWIDLHGLRSWRSGARPHFDLHLIVPRYFDVEQTHRIHDEISGVLLEEAHQDGDVVIHFDPCAATDCRRCAMDPCAVREQPFDGRRPFSATRAMRTDDDVHAD